MQEKMDVFNFDDLPLEFKKSEIPDFKFFLNLFQINQNGGLFIEGDDTYSRLINKRSLIQKYLNNHPAGLERSIGAKEVAKNVKFFSKEIGKDVPPEVVISVHKEKILRLINQGHLADVLGSKTQHMMGIILLRVIRNLDIPFSLWDDSWNGFKDHYPLSQESELSFNAFVVNTMDTLVNTYERHQNSISQINFSHNAFSSKAGLLQKSKFESKIANLNRFIATTFEEITTSKEMNHLSLYPIKTVKTLLRWVKEEKYLVEMIEETKQEIALFIKNAKKTQKPESMPIRDTMALEQSEISQKNSDEELYLGQLVARIDTIDKRLDKGTKERFFNRWKNGVSDELVGIHTTLKKMIISAPSLEESILYYIEETIRLSHILKNNLSSNSTESINKKPNDQKIIHTEKLVISPEDQDTVDVLVRLMKAGGISSTWMKTDSFADGSTYYRLILPLLYFIKNRILSGSFSVKDGFSWKSICIEYAAAVESNNRLSRPIAILINSIPEGADVSSFREALPSLIEILDNYSKVLSKSQASEALQLLRKHLDTHITRALKV